MSDRTVARHLGWCVQENCTEDEHRGRLIRLNPEVPELARITDVITVQLVQTTAAGQPHTGQPAIEITASHRGDAPWHLIIDLEQGRELTYTLGRQVGIAYRQMLAHARRVQP